MASPVQGWRAQAACRSVNTRLFYPDSGKHSAYAVAVCSSCLVRTACLEHALEVGERHGVWGGKTEDERRTIRRQRTTAS